MCKTKKQKKHEDSVFQNTAKFEQNLQKNVSKTSAEKIDSD